MLKTCFSAVLILFTVFLSACAPADKYQDKFWVITDVSSIHERPDSAAKLLKELKLGDEVYCRDKNPSYAVPRGWIEARSGDARGFIEKKGIAEETLYNDIKAMMDSAKDAPAQGGGITGKKIYFRLKPDKSSFAIGHLKTPTDVDVLERLVVSVDEKGKGKKHVWYKIRLSDGRAGFIPSNYIQLIPPSELNAYTQVRTAVSWYKLGEKEDPATKEKGSDYLVSYSSFGSDIGTDFTRIELYTYEPKSKKYATALAKSGLYGILPIKISDADSGGKIIELREYPHGDKKRIHVMQYSYPSPIKIVKEYVEDAAEK